MTKTVKKTPKSEAKKYFLSDEIPGSYKACCYMESGICFDNLDLRDCCISFDGHTRGLPVIIPNYRGEIPNWNKVFEYKEKRNQEVLNGNIPHICDGCGCLNENIKFTGKRCFSEVVYQSNYFCDAKCIYCSSKVNRGVELYSALKVTKNIIKNGLFKKGGNVFLLGGEPLIMRDFDKIISEYLKQDANIFIESSCISYSDSVLEGLKKGKLKFLVSIDSGNRKLYSLIKQTDKFDKVIENLKKYAEVLNKNNKNNLTVKYLIIPGVNDSVKQIDEFLNLAKKIKVKSVRFDIETCYLNSQNGVLPDYLYYLEDYAEYSSLKKNLIFSLHFYYEMAERTRKIGKYSFENFDKKSFIEKIEEEKIINISKNRYYAGIPINFSGMKSK